ADDARGPLRSNRVAQPRARALLAREHDRVRAAGLRDVPAHARWHHPRRAAPHPRAHPLTARLETGWRPAPLTHRATRTKQPRFRFLRPGVRPGKWTAPGGTMQPLRAV